MCIVKVHSLTQVLKLVRTAIKHKDNFTISVHFESDDDETIDEVLDHIKDGGLE